MYCISIERDLDWELTKKERGVECPDKNF